MRITKFILFGLAVLIVSCGEDEVPVLNENFMTGTWAISGLTYSGTTTTTEVGSAPVTTTFAGLGKDYNLTTTFSMAPNLVDSEGSYIIELSSTTMGTTIVEEFLFDEIITDGTWSLSGKILTITATGGGTQTAEIVNHSSKSFQVKIETSTTETGAGFIIETQITGTYTFARQ